MQALHKEIFELQTRINDNEEKISYRFTELGKIILKTDPAKLAGTVISETCQDLHKLLKVEPQKKNDIESIRELEKNLAAARTRTKEKKKELSTRENETKQHYRAVGELSYQIFKENSGMNETFKNIFFDLTNVDEKLARNSQGRSDFKEVTQTDRKENILKQFVNIAKTIYFEKKQDLLSSRQISLYTQAGRKVMESDFSKVNADDGLSQAIIPLKALTESIQQIKLELTNLNETEKKIIQNLIELGVRGNYVKRITDIENEIEAARAHVNAKFEELGRQYLQNARDLKFTLQTGNELIEGIKLLNSENETFRKKIKKLNARIDIDKIKEKIAKNAKIIEDLKARMNREKEEIKTYSATNTNFEAEIQRIIKENELDE